MEKIIITPFVLYKLNNLVDILFHEEYFGFKESARDYVNTLADFIYSLPNAKRYPTKNIEFGAWYCRYKKNRHTSWYIIFDMDDDVFLVKNIINNHTKNYPEFISRIK